MVFDAILFFDIFVKTPERYQRYNYFPLFSFAFTIYLPVTNFLISITSITLDFFINSRYTASVSSLTRAA
jgi:hypothetical protein